MKSQENWKIGKAKSVECRKRDLVIRISDWTRQKDEPAYDVEVYIGGVYHRDESESFTTKSRGISKRVALGEAIQFAQMQIERHAGKTYNHTTNET